MNKSVVQLSTRSVFAEDSVQKPSQGPGQRPVNFRIHAIFIWAEGREYAVYSNSTLYSYNSESGSSSMMWVR